MKKALVAYFSASGTTKKAAEKLAKGINADLFEIQPQTPYTNADLDWQNSQSRSSVEMNDKSSRPEIRRRIENIAQYDVIFIGFPIWWYREPSIIDTFMESYDFSGKQIIPFATSGGSGIGKSGRNLKALAHGANVDSGKCFAPGTTQKSLLEWAKKWL